MFESLTIGRPFGVTVRVHVLFLYLVLGLVLWGAFQGHGLPVLVMLVMLFGLVLLHELGHALVARRYGLKVFDIVLWPLGGMARMSEIPENSRVEAGIAIAGPLVNLALASLGIVLLTGLYGVEALQHGFVSNSSFDDSLWTFAPVAILRTFVVMNLALGLFNLVPAFPMDGGRLLRAFLGRGGRSWVLATERAAQVGRVIAWVMIVLGIVGQTCSLPLIGLFVLWAGARERWQVRLRHRQPAFGGAGFGPGPGAEAGMSGLGGLAELLRRARAESTGESDAPGGEHGTSIGPPGGGGFSDEDVENLETFRGSLRKRPRDD